MSPVLLTIIFASSLSLASQEGTASRIWKLEELLMKAKHPSQPEATALANKRSSSSSRQHYGSISKKIYHVKYIRYIPQRQMCLCSWAGDERRGQNRDKNQGVIRGLCVLMIKQT